MSNHPATWWRRISVWSKPRWVVITLVMVGFLAPTTLALIHSQATSPLDEWVFVDYTQKVFTQGYVRRGERVGTFTANLMACSGSIPHNTFGKCGSGEAIYSELPYGGQTGAADYTPAYFWVTAAVGGGIHLITGINELTSWRITGAFWMAAAMLMLWLLFRRWKIAETTTLVLGLLVIASPYSMWANSFVSTDAPALFIGASLLYVATRIRFAEISPWWLLVVAPIAMAFKVTNLVAVGLVAIYLFGSWLIGAIRKRTAYRDLPSISLRAGVIAPGLMLGLSAAVPIVWSKFLAATALPVPSQDQGISSAFTINELGLQATNFIGQTLTYNPLMNYGFDFLWAPITWVSIAGIVGAVFMQKRWSLRAEMASAIAIAAVVMAPVLAIALWLTTHNYFQLSPRYGATLIPAFMLSAAVIVRNNYSRWIIGSYAVLLIASDVVMSVHLLFVA